MSRFPVCRYNKDQSRTKLKLDNLRFYKLFLFEGFKIYLKMAANGVLKMTYLSMRGLLLHLTLMVDFLSAIRELYTNF